MKALPDADLSRFVAAQAETYARALAELRAGAKRSHWMWFIFPQIAGLGHSAMAQRYAVRDGAEAEAYLAAPLLAPRLREACEAVLGWAGRRSAETIMGGIDAVKLRSSCTLFEAAGGGEPFARIIDAFYGGERDDRTLQLLGQERSTGAPKAYQSGADAVVAARSPPDRRP